MLAFELLDVLAEIKCPNLLVMHFKGVLAHLLLDVPNFDYAVNTGRTNLQTHIEPIKLNKCSLMPL